MRDIIGYIKADFVQTYVRNESKTDLACWVNRGMVVSETPCELKKMTYIGLR